MSLNTRAQNLMYDLVENTTMATSLDEASWTISASVRPARPRALAAPCRGSRQPSAAIARCQQPATKFQGSANTTKLCHRVLRQAPSSCILADDGPGEIVSTFEFMSRPQPPHNGDFQTVIFPGFPGYALYSSAQMAL